MGKGKDPRLEPEPDPDPDQYLLLVDPDPGGPKTCGSGSPTLGARRPAFTLVTITYKVAVYASAEGGRYTHSVFSLPLPSSYG